MDDPQIYLACVIVAPFVESGALDRLKAVGLVKDVVGAGSTRLGDVARLLFQLVDRVPLEMRGVFCTREQLIFRAGDLLSRQVQAKRMDWLEAARILDCLTERKMSLNQVVYVLDQAIERIRP